MKKSILAIIACICTTFVFCACESLNSDNNKGTVYGLWVVDSLNVEVSTTINGNTTKHTSLTNFTTDYCRLYLEDNMLLATLWYNFDTDIEGFSYVETDSSRRITFKEGLNAGDNGKAIVLLGIYDVELIGDRMIFKQPEASIGGTTYGASERATYYFHRAPKSEKPKDAE